MFLNKHKILSTINSKQAFIELINYGNNWKINYIITRLKKGNLYIETKQNNINSFDELRKKLPSNLPTHFIINGDGVLFRIVNNTEQLEANELISDTFNTLDLSDVYFENNNDGNINYLSIIRKEKLNNILNKLRETGFKPASIQAGYSNIHLLGKYLDSNISSVIIEGMSFNFQEGNLQSCNKTKEAKNTSYNIDIENIESEYLNVFCLAMVGYTTNSFASYCVDLAILNQKLFEEMYYSKLATQGWKTAVGILFSLLLMNFILFDYLNKQNNELSQQIYQIEKGRETIIQQEKQSIDDTRILLEYGFLNNNNYSQYIDELSNSLISGMHFIELEINPQVVQKTSKSLTIKAGYIIVEGINEGAKGIELFEQNVKNKSWIKSTNLRKVSRKNNSSNVYFSLVIDFIN